MFPIFSEPFSEPFSGPFSGPGFALEVGKDPRASR
jgi:hypothetical protein